MAKKKEKAKAKAVKKPAETKPSATGGPKFRLRAVYIKDVSFESPLAPAVFAAGVPQPKIRLEVNVGVQHLEGLAFEVALKIEAEAKLPDNKTLFLLELLQGAVFALSPGMDEATARKVLATDCAAALFPFARQSVAEITRNGGFAPLVLDQIEFTV